MPAAPTTEKLDGAPVRQFSVFLQNKVGALLEVVKLLNEHHVVVLALSIQDSSESSIGRMVVSDPERVTQLFHEHEVPFSECEVLVVELREGAADLAKVLAALLMAEVNIYFSYPLLVRPRGRAVLAMHLDDIECSSSVLRGDGFKILTQA
ncbi:MAG: acetolactate synthase, partial [Terrimicrobiaceae bacterium]